VEIRGKRGEEKRHINGFKLKEESIPQQDIETKISRKLFDL
jgi:hypothetical protein